jgi:hypothetical protein
LIYSFCFVFDMGGFYPPVSLLWRRYQVSRLFRPAFCFSADVVVGGRLFHLLMTSIIELPSKEHPHIGQYKIDSSLETRLTCICSFGV